MEHFNVTLVKSIVPNRPYCKVDGKYAGPTWRNNIGIQRVPYSIEAVHQLCLKLADDPTVCMVYGSALHDRISNTDRTMANFEEQPTHLLTLDLDNYEGGLKDEYPTYEEAVREADEYIRNYLPPEFIGVSYILRFSSSFLAKDHRFRCHIVFLLADAQYPREIGTWIKSDNIQADPTFYLNLTQPIFTASPVFKDNVNPLDRIHGYFPRVSLVKKSRETVPEGWQPYTVEAKKPLDLSNLPEANNLPGKIGSFCRNVSIIKALESLGYEDQGDARFLSPTSKTGLPGVKVFNNGYCYTHHSDDPITQIKDGIFNGKRNSFNSYDLMYGWAKLHREDNPALMKQFDFILSQAISDDQEYQDEVMNQFEFRTEWLLEEGYVGQNKTIVDSLLKDMMEGGLNEMSRSHVFDLINVKTKKHIKLTDLKRAWKGMRRDKAFNKYEFDPEAGLRLMADIFLQRQIIHSHNKTMTGDFWCYMKEKRMWQRLNKDQTAGFIYKHLHEAMPLKQEIDFYRVENLTKIILRQLTLNPYRFTPGKGWAFKGGKVGILMDSLFEGKWRVEDNIRTLKREHNIYKEMPITYDQWKSAPDMPNKFNDFLNSTCEEDYEKVELLQEYFGYILADSYYLHQFLLLEGVPGSGKSIMTNILRGCFGRKFFTALDLNKIGGPFGLGDLPGKKLAVISEAREINFHQLRDAIPVILKLVGHDPIAVEAKHKSATTEMLECKLLMTTNRAPVMPDDTGALAQRMIMVRLHKSFRGTDEEILGLDDTIIKTEIPSVIKWSLAGLERLSDRKRFYIPQSVTEEAVYYKEQLDPLQGFVTEFFRFDENAADSDYIDSKLFTDYYQAYLYRIGQVIERGKVQKKAALPKLRSMDKRIDKKMVRNGLQAYRAIKPLVPVRNLEMEFVSERSEIAQMKGGDT